MRDFTDYKRRKIARYYQSCENTWQTIKKFDITYKELYKIINTTRFLSYKTIKWQQYKKCPSCKNMLILSEENFYKRKWTSYYQSSCKNCMKTLSKIYRIDNREKVNTKRKEWFKQHYKNNKEKVLIKAKNYYYKYKRFIKQKRSRYYKRSKAQFLKRIFNK